MKFNDLDKRMRFFETAQDQVVLPGIYMVARLDGRGFTNLTKKDHDFEAPFDPRFRDMMIATTLHLMDCGFKVIFGYTQSDEISLLFHPLESGFNRKLRKWNSVLAGEASAKFSLGLGAMGVFDCRISQLPKVDDVVEYFRWRSSDATRNSLNAHCYWTLRNEGWKAKKATKKIEGKTVSEKNEFLFERGINFNDLPIWKKRGMGFYWEEYEKKGWNPVKKQEEVTQRKRLKTDMELPKGAAFGDLVKSILLKADQGGA